jgi:hypothetical protein
VRAEHADRLPVHVWVDGLRYAGSRQQVNDALARADARAKTVGATWKVATEAEQKYDFIGVAWDHAAHTVRVADKTAAKIRAVSIEKLSIVELGQLVGRLIFAAGVTRTPLARFYFAMKGAARGEQA